MFYLYAVKLKHNTCGRFTEKLNAVFIPVPSCAVTSHFSYQEVESITTSSLLDQGIPLAKGRRQKRWCDSSKPRPQEAYVFPLRFLESSWRIRAHTAQKSYTSWGHLRPASSQGACWLTADTWASPTKVYSSWSTHQCRSAHLLIWPRHSRAKVKVYSPLPLRFYVSYTALLHQQTTHNTYTEKRTNFKCTYNSVNNHKVNSWANQYSDQGTAHQLYSRNICWVLFQLAHFPQRSLQHYGFIFPFPSNMLLYDLIPSQGQADCWDNPKVVRALFSFFLSSLWDHQWDAGSYQDQLWLVVSFSGSPMLNFWVVCCSVICPVQCFRLPELAFDNPPVAKLLVSRHASWLNSQLWRNGRRRLRMGEVT